MSASQQDNVFFAKEWKHISNEKAAAAMGHDIDVHSRNYQRWISTEAKKQTFMDSVEIN